MFHSASSRHEQYVTIQHKRSHPRLSSEANKLTTTPRSPDSGYDSQSSPPAHVVEAVHTNDTLSTTSSITSSLATHTTTDSRKKTKKKKKKRKERYLDENGQPPRQPDYVYSCPRPLAFPFHNDSHFLPVAEADPRDVARIAPPRRVPSMESTRTSTRASSLDSHSTYSRTSSSYQYSRNSTSSIGSSIRSSGEGGGASSHHSVERPASTVSFMGSVHQNTVRSLRSLFNIEDKDKAAATAAAASSNASIASSERLPRLEPKVGTVSSLRKLFSRNSKELAPDQARPTPKKAQNTRESVLLAKARDTDELTAINTRKNRDMGDRTKSLFFGKRRPTDKPQPAPSSSASLLFGLWPKPPTAPPSTTSTTASSMPRRPATAPLPRTSTDDLENLPRPPTSRPSSAASSRRESPLPPLPKPSISESIKNLFTRPVPAVPPSTETQTPISPEMPVPPPPAATVQPRRSIFSAFRRSPTPSPRTQTRAEPTDNGAKDPKVAKLDPTATPTDESLASTPTTTVGRIWKSFKRLVTGKKSSRVGIL